MLNLLRIVTFLLLSLFANARPAPRYVLADLSSLAAGATVYVYFGGSDYRRGTFVSYAHGGFVINMPRKGNKSFNKTLVYVENPALKK